MSTTHPLFRHLRLRRADGNVYLDRRGIQTRWFNVYLHHIGAPDPGRALHNHPWVFWSFVVRGGYTEQVSPAGSWKACLRQRRWSLHKMPLSSWHRIISVEPNTWTLIVTGPARQKWGFDTPEGFVPHGEYEFAGLATQDNEAR